MTKHLFFTGSANQPTVAVRPKVLEKLGEPTCDYDALEDLFYGALRMPAKQPVTIDLYNGISSHLGYYNFLNKGVVHVNAPIAHAEGRLPAVLLHEGQHMADYILRRSQFLGWYALRATVSTILLDMPVLVGMRYGIAPTIPATGAALLSILGYNTHIDPMEKAGLQTGSDSQLLERYAGTITFST